MRTMHTFLSAIIHETTTLWDSSCKVVNTSNFFLAFKYEFMSTMEHSTINTQHQVYIL